ncbi:MAG: hypothetical protein GWN58_58580 [Anaerolineae bacterium]|nr:hypothetical protein [Anaerolineae bacterium]
MIVSDGDIQEICRVFSKQHPALEALAREHARYDALSMRGDICAEQCALQAERMRELIWSSSDFVRCLRRVRRCIDCGRITVRPRLYCRVCDSPLQEYLA